MKQPELGKKLTELRKARGLTQEELVERCHVSVRTIQRIETGEVVPRSYTVRTIVAALDYSFEDIFTGSALSDSVPDDSAQADDSQTARAQTDQSQTDHGSKIDPSNRELGPFSEGKTLFQPDPYPTSVRGVVAKLKVALVFGLIYFILTFPEAIAEYFRFSNDEIIFGNALYTILKIAIAFSFLFFQRGFMLIGTVYNYYLIRIVAVIHVVITFALCLYDAGSLYVPHDPAFMIFTAAILYGAIGLCYGYALIRLRRALGTILLLAGGLEIVSAVLFLTVALIPLADFINMFAELLELIILFKVMDLMKRRPTANFM